MSRYPQRIVCLTEETTETLYLLGAGDRVVGVSGYTARPPEARQKPKVSAFINARFDKILALEPDLVLAFSDLQADIAAELIRRGCTVVTFNQRSVAEILPMIRMLGGLVGLSDRGRSGWRTSLERGLDAHPRVGDAFHGTARGVFRRVGRPADFRESDGSKNSSRSPAARRSFPSCATPDSRKTASSPPTPCATQRRTSSLRRGAARKCSKATIAGRPGWDDRARQWRTGTSTRSNRRTSCSRARRH